MRWLWAAPVCVAVAMVYAWFDDESGIRPWLALRHEVRELETRIERLRGEIGVLEAEIASFEEGPFALERAIREELDWVRPGEILVRMPRSRGLGAPVP